MKYLALSCVFIMLACGRADVAEDPVWGKEPCAHCAMLVGDRATAAQAIDAKGERRFFDDIGCLVLWTTEQAKPPRIAWVAGPHGWLLASTAHYQSGAVTPMDFGFIATEASNGVGYDEMARAVLARRARGGTTGND